MEAPFALLSPILLPPSLGQRSRHTALGEYLPHVDYVTALPHSVLPATLRKEYYPHVIDEETET